MHCHPDLGSGSHIIQSLYKYPEVFSPCVNLNSKFLAYFIHKIYIVADLQEAGGGDPWASRKSGGFSAYFLLNLMDLGPVC